MPQYYCYDPLNEEIDEGRSIGASDPFEAAEYYGKLKDRTCAAPHNGRVVMVKIDDGLEGGFEEYEINVEYEPTYRAIKKP